MGDSEQFEDFYSKYKRRVQEFEKKRDDILDEMSQKEATKVCELIGILTSDDKAFSIKALSGKTKQYCYKTVCQNCGAPHSPQEAKCEYCGGYVDVGPYQIEKEPEEVPYSFKQWDGEKWVSKVVNPMEMVQTKKLPTKNIIG